MVPANLAAGSGSGVLSGRRPGFGVGEDRNLPPLGIDVKVGEVVAAPAHRPPRQAARAQRPATNPESPLSSSTGSPNVLVFAAMSATNGSYSAMCAPVCPSRFHTSGLLHDHHSLGPLIPGLAGLGARAIMSFAVALILPNAGGDSP